MKYLIIILSISFLVSCSEHQRVITPETRWDREQMLVSDSQVEMLKKHVEVLLSHPPSTLSGHDQDWDKAIKASYEETRNTLIKPVMVEYATDSRGWFKATGRWKQIEEMK